MKRRKQQGSIIKKLFILAFFGLVLVILVGQFFLGSIVKNVINTKSGQFITSKAEVQNIGISILGGSLDVIDLKVYSPEGFEGEAVYTLGETFANLSYMSLLKKQINIEEIAIIDSILNVERNKDGDINVLSLLPESEEPKTQEAAPSEPIETKEEVTPAKKDSTPVAIPDFLLQSLIVTSELNYKDLKTKKPFEIAFSTDVDIKNIKNFGSPDDIGTVIIKGHLKENSNEFLTSIIAEVAPLTDFCKPTFKAKTIIESVNMDKLSAYQGKTGIKQGKVSIQSSIVCIDGIIQKDESIQKISIKDLLITDKMKDKLKGNVPPSDIAFSFHLYGSIDKIESDFLNAFLTAVFNPKNMLAGKASDKLSKELSKNKDAQKALAGTGMATSLGLNMDTQETAAEENTEEATPAENTQESTTETEVVEETAPVEEKPAVEKKKEEVEEKAKAKIKSLKKLF